MKYLFTLLFVLLMAASASALSLPSHLTSMDSEDAQRCYYDRFASGCSWKMGPAFENKDVTRIQKDCYDHKFVGRICSDSGRFSGVYADGRAKVIDDGRNRYLYSPSIENPTPTQTIVTRSMKEGDSFRFGPYSDYLTAGKARPYYYIQHEEIGPTGPRVIRGNLAQHRIIKRKGYNTDLDVTVKGRYFN